MLNNLSLKKNQFILWLMCSIVLEIEEKWNLSGKIKTIVSI